MSEIKIMTGKEIQVGLLQLARKIAKRLGRVATAEDYNLLSEEKYIPLKGEGGFEEVIDKLIIKYKYNQNDYIHTADINSEVFDDGTIKFLEQIKSEIESK